MPNSKLFNGYWMGYQPDGNPLNTTPTYINRVTLFVAAPAPDGTSLGVNYLCKAHPQAQMIAQARQLQQQGAEVLLSLMDTKSTHWNNVDIPAFVQNVKAEVIDGEWGLNGIDVDLESQMPGSVWSQTFITLIQELRRVLGPKSTTDSNGKAIARLSVAAFLPTVEQKILEAIGSELDWLNTMAYGNDATGNESLFAAYAKYVQCVNLGIGVDYQKGQSTDLDQVKQTAAFAAATSNCGMMEFGLNNDCPQYSQQPIWTWASAIQAGLLGQ